MEEAMIASDTLAKRAGNGSEGTAGEMRQPGSRPLLFGDSRNTGGMPGEMALQGAAGDLSTQSTPQGLVRLVGHRDPSRIFVAPPQRDARSRG
jgi:hypothetical protein